MLQPRLPSSTPIVLKPSSDLFEGLAAHTRKLLFRFLTGRWVLIEITDEKMMIIIMACMEIVKFTVNGGFG